VRAEEGDHLPVEFNMEGRAVEAFAISSRGKSTSRDARPHWRSGAPSRHRSSFERGRVPYESTNRRYFDNARPLDTLRLVSVRIDVRPRAGMLLFFCAIRSDAFSCDE
jgi:hypothetical protein